MTRFLSILTLVTLSACGGGSGGVVGPPPVTTPPVPAASITAAGAGTLVLHPSLDPRFSIAMVTPIRITEGAGGAADWGFARMPIFNRGVEIERTELTAANIRAAGYGRIGASTNAVYNMVFRFNSDNFDRIDLTLGFSDVRDARQFTVSVPFNSFTDVNLGFTPLSLPRSSEKL